MRFIVVEQCPAGVHCCSQDSADIREICGEDEGALVGDGVQSQVDCREKGVVDVDWHGIVCVGDLRMAFGAAGRSVVGHRLCWQV
jgi:hypothetical protein